MPYDIVLLSCEGGETYNANPPALEAYLNAGGRAFASHFHYAWFAGPLESAQSYTAPADWGNNLATWTGDGGGDEQRRRSAASSTRRSTASTQPFPKGVALQTVAARTSARSGRTACPPASCRSTSRATTRPSAPTNTPSQPWITSDASGMPGATMYFSFDTPVNAPPAPDGGAPNYCGRAVFSDLHVARRSRRRATARRRRAAAHDADLSPQEKALEFMLFDLSSCVIPDTMPPPTGVPIG